MRKVGRPRKKDKLVTLRMGVPQSIVNKLGEDKIKELWKKILEDK
jgi:hypothetical protein